MPLSTKSSDLPTPLVGGEDLRAALGFRTAEAFRAARRAGRVPVKVMKIQGRRGWFALTEDLAQWQASLTGQGAEPGKEVPQTAESNNRP